MRGVAVDGFLAAVIDRQLFEVAQYADIELGRPSVAADLKGRFGIDFNVDGRFLGFHEENVRDRRIGRRNPRPSRRHPPQRKTSCTTSRYFSE